MQLFPRAVQKQLLTDQLHEIEAYTIYSRLAERIITLGFRFDQFAVFRISI